MGNIIIELIFEKLNHLDAGYVNRVLNQNLDKISYKLHPKVESVTSTPKYLVIILSIPDEFNPFSFEGRRLIYVIAGGIVFLLNFNARFINYEVHGVTSSLLFKKEWRDVKVALCVIAKDEAPYVDEFMSKIRGFFDDIVVGVDTRTKDSTWDEFAKRGARCFYIGWEDDFSKLRNNTMKFVAPEIDWVFWLDVDEEPEMELLLNLRNMVKTDRFDAYGFTLINSITGTVEKGKIRLFRRSKGRWEGRVHEVVRGIPEERICHTDFKILHKQRWIASGGKIKEERNAFYRRLEKMS